MVKAVIPAERLCHVHLEKDSLDWETICQFLDKPIPEGEFPGRNEPEKFQQMLEGFLQPIVKTAAIRFGVFAVSALAVVGWASMKYGPFVLATFQ